LHWAASFGYEVTIGYLIAWGADINSVDYKGLTPLHITVKNFRKNRSATRCVKQLLMKGANKNAVDFNNKKPIDYILNQTTGDKVAIEIEAVL